MAARRRKRNADVVVEKDQPANSPAHGPQRKRKAVGGVIKAKKKGLRLTDAQMSVARKALQNFKTGSKKEVDDIFKAAAKVKSMTGEKSGRLTREERAMIRKGLQGVEKKKR